MKRVRTNANINREKTKTLEKTSKVLSDREVGKNRIYVNKIERRCQNTIMKIVFKIKKIKNK